MVYIYMYMVHTDDIPDELANLWACLYPDDTQLLSSNSTCNCSSLLEEYYSYFYSMSQTVSYAHLLQSI